MTRPGLPRALALCVPCVSLYRGSEALRREAGSPADIRGDRRNALLVVTATGHPRREPAT